MIFSQMFDMLDVGIMILDSDLKVFKWNRWMATHSKILPEKIVGKSIFEFFPDLNAPWFLRNCKSVFTFGNFAFFSQKLHKYCFPFKAYNTLGSDFEYMQQSCTVGPLRDDNNRINYIYITVQDVTEVAAYEKKLINMNTRDGLTGIFNRRYLETKLEEEFDRHIRYNRPLSLIMLDIDHFKGINDNYGHQAGDFILKSLATLIDERIRVVDIVARYGGEEFCCLLPETTAESALALAEFLRMGVEAEIYHFKDKSIKITISQGVSDLNSNVDTAEMLLKLADDGLYEAKRAGRNKVSMISNKKKES
ncbi:MAG: diguanylate cyclase [Desulfobacteraceae bacterium]|nr:MAG: diguanylate cyclase [Desulfobacteraceae bacterium]